GAAALEGASAPKRVPQCGSDALAGAFQTYSNYVALPSAEAFRIDYWSLEAPRLRRQPREKELSRQIALVVGGGNGIGREVALLAAARGAHVVVADRDFEVGKSVTEELKKTGAKKSAAPSSVDIRIRDSIREAMRETVKQFGGVDIVV